jgi:hypothetical protein
MKREIAIRILGHVKALDGPLNSAAAAVEEIDDPAEKRLFRRGIASVIGLVYTDVIVEIEKRFPDLAPPKAE